MCITHSRNTTNDKYVCNTQTRTTAQLYIVHRVKTQTYLCNTQTKTTRQLYIVNRVGTQTTNMYALHSLGTQQICNTQTMTTTNM